MPLIEELDANGRWLFRRRSYLPLVLLALVLASYKFFSYPQGSETLDHVWECFCLAVGVFGLLIRGLVAGYVPRGTSGRNARQQVAETLNTTGMYSITRNPLYFGNFFMGLAVILFLRVWWNPVIYTLLFMLYYERIIFAEERFLQKKFGEEFVEWANHTPAFIPRLKGWRKPPLPFSFRTFIRREYQSAFALIITLFCLEVLSELYLKRHLQLDSMWLWIVGLGAGMYLFLRLLNKLTDVLKEQGR